MKWFFEVWREQRYEWTPFPEYRIRLRLFGMTMTLWRWNG